MSLYKPSELLQFLEGLGIQPKKGLSQNFLIDGNIIRKIIATAEVAPGDLVLEVGPGPGVLTEALLHAGAEVIAIEKDTVLAHALERLQTSDRRLEVHTADILDVDVGKLLKRKAKLIANLPYHLTTPILERFIPMRHLFSDLIVMVQDEVARRLTAAPGSRTYGSLTVFLNYYTTPRYAFQVSKNCFYPAPKVQSAIVALKLKEPPYVSNEELFFQMTRTSFSQRRKMLKASLRPLYSPDDVMQQLQIIGKDPYARPEELSLENFVALFLALTTKK